LFELESSIKSVSSTINFNTLTRS